MLPKTWIQLNSRRPVPVLSIGNLTASQQQCLLRALLRYHTYNTRVTVQYTPVITYMVTLHAYNALSVSVT